MIQSSASYAQPTYYDVAKQQTATRTTRKVTYKPARWLRREKLLIVAFFVVAMIMAVSILWQNIQSNTAVATKNDLTQKTQQIDQRNDAMRDQIVQATNQSRLNDTAKKAHMSRSDDRIRDINR